MKVISYILMCSLLSSLALAQAVPAPVPAPAADLDGSFVDRPVAHLHGGDVLETLKIGSDITTLVVFPEPVTLLTGYGLAATPELASPMIKSQVSLVQFENVAPDSIAFRLLQTGTKPCVVTVRYGKAGVALLRLMASETPDVLATVASGGASLGSGSPQNMGSGEVTVAQSRELEASDITDTRIQYSADELIGILCRAKERKFLERVNPSLYAGWTERNNLKLSAMSGPIHTTITEIQRWPEKDAVIITGTLTNTGKAMATFDPKDVMVRLGERLYPVQFADSGGKVPPQETRSISVILQGNVAGGREHLSVDNDFHLVMPSTVGPMPPLATPEVVPVPAKGTAAFPFDRIYGTPWKDRAPDITQPEMAQK